MNIDFHRYSPVLLIVDMQRLFTEADGPFANPDGEALCHSVNALIRQWSALSRPILVSSYVLAEDGSDAGLLREHPIVKQGFFSEGNAWSKLDPKLDIPEHVHSLTRNRPGAFHNGALARLLEELDCNALVLCGLSVNNAISTTAREAFAHDIPAVVVRDATGAAPGETHESVYFEILDTWTASVMSTDALFHALE